MSSPLKILFLALALSPIPAPAQLNPLEPPSTGGLAAVDRDLAKLLVHARLLVIGAHPDDEDTSLLALVARGMGGEAAYLSLSRGEGGQNLIGPELGVGLGLLRTEELLAARRLDGARQYFTRAYDFGYTRSLDETLRRWPRAVLLEDTLRVVRRFRPQVVVSIFPADGGGGHGQHQAAGVVAHQAYTAAADPTVAPQLGGEGLAPWAPQALYRATWFDREATTLVLPTGILDPSSGRSLYQLAMASRSQHRSQDMGRLQEPGPQQARVGWVAGGDGVGGAVLFAGVDTRLRAIALLLPEGPVRDAAWRDLETVETLTVEARRRLQPADLSGAQAPLLAIVGTLRRVHEGAVTARSAAAADFLAEKLAAAERALVAVSGLVLDASTERSTVIPGEPFKVAVALWNAGGAPVAIAGVELVSPAGWRQTSAPPVAQEVVPGALGSWSLEAAAPAAALTVPYFLERPLDGDLYHWETAPAAVRGLPFQEPPLSVRVRIGLGATSIVVDREVVQRYGDQALGEVRRPLRAVPPIEVRVAPDLVVTTLHPDSKAVKDAKARQEKPREESVEIVLTSHLLRAATGRIEVTTPAGWPTPAPWTFQIGAATPREVARAAIQVPIRLPASLQPGRYSVRATATLDDGTKSSGAVPLVDYPHVRPVPLPVPSAVDVVTADIGLPALRRVGYIAGSSDRVPAYLEGVGVPIEMLGELELGEADLSVYDAIVVGSRAYETVPALGRTNARLLDYVRGGGLLLVQYQQYPFVDGGYAPLKLEIARPHDRITDETAPVVVLDPAHAALTLPNRIGAEDWTGWVQERGLYFAHEWDPGYVPLLELTDPGQPPQRGGLLVAQVGKGTYVYTGLAFFRQLPAGVPGAYRLFANLLGLGAPASGKAE